MSEPDEDDPAIDYSFTNGRRREKLIAAGTFKTLRLSSAYPGASVSIAMQLVKAVLQPMLAAARARLQNARMAILSHARHCLYFAH